EVKQRFQLPEEPWPVHRLDKDTTGALLLARSRLQAREFQVQFKEHDIKKTYLALVQAGEDAFLSAPGSIRNVLVYDLNGRFDRVVSVKADAAVTHWRLLGSSRKVPISLVSLELETGSKHQLRIHLSKVLNAPVLGDPLYSSNHHLSYLPGIGIQRGLYLHASHVSFHSYRQFGRYKRFRVGITAPLPPYFAQACKKLKIPLEDELIEGGVRINDVQQDLSVLRERGGNQDGMRWLL
ncbi:pseudouridine synthase, partial [Thelephora ganbajun]